MCVTICGEFDSNEGGIAGYVDRMRSKFPAKWDVRMAVMNFPCLEKSPANCDAHLSENNF